MRSDHGDLIHPGSTEPITLGCAGSDRLTLEELRRPDTPGDDSRWHVGPECKAHKRDSPRCYAESWIRRGDDEAKISMDLHITRCHKVRIVLQGHVGGSPSDKAAA